VSKAVYGKPALEALLKRVLELETNCLKTRNKNKYTLDIFGFRIKLLNVNGVKLNPSSSGLSKLILK
jgi:hypothetical protein